MTERARVLLVEDDDVLGPSLRHRFALEGFDPLLATSAREAMAALRRHGFAAIVSDIRLPDGDGESLYRAAIGLLGRTPILFVTAHGDVEQAVRLIKAGADDYLTKPFSMRELVARVKALLRRVRIDREEFAAATASNLGGERMVFDALVIDLSRREVSFQGVVHHLKPKEFDLLVFLARNRGIVLSRDLILERVWGWEFDGGSRTVDVHVRWLREKIEANPSDPQRIVTVRGVGYRFEGAV